MLQESEIIPYHCSPPVGERILVLAPHPDDETLGCGGTIRLLLEAKKQVKVLFLTSGDKADLTHPLVALKRGGDHITDYSLMREKEAIKALRVLQVSDVEFLRFPDRELHVHYQNVLDRILPLIHSYAPDTFYGPSPVELNPDHRTTAILAFEIQRRMQKDGLQATIMFYEVTVPLRPNLLVDITPVFRGKKRAIKKYRSQLKLNRYLECITAMNIFRTVTVKGTQYIEAFWQVHAPLNNEEIARWVSYSEPGHTQA